MQPLWKTVWQFLIKQNIRLPYNPTITVLGIYPKELKTCPQKNCTRIVYSNFIHKCRHLEATKTSFSRWMDKLWYIQTMEYYSVLKRNELSNHEKTWKKLRYTLLSESSQSAKATYCTIPTIRHCGNGKTLESLNRSWVAKGWEWGEVRDEQEEHRGFSGQWKPLCVTL